MKVATARGAQACIVARIASGHQLAYRQLRGALDTKVARARTRIPETA